MVLVQRSPARDCYSWISSAVAALYLPDTHARLAPVRSCVNCCLHCWRCTPALTVLPILTGWTYGWIQLLCPRLLVPWFALPAGSHSHLAPLAYPFDFLTLKVPAIPDPAPQLGRGFFLLLLHNDWTATFLRIRLPWILVPVGSYLTPPGSAFVYTVAYCRLALVGRVTPLPPADGFMVGLVGRICRCRSRSALVPPSALYNPDYLPVCRPTNSCLLPTVLTVGQRSPHTTLPPRITVAGNVAFCRNSGSVACAYSHLVIASLYYNDCYRQIDAVHYTVV